MATSLANDIILEQLKTGTAQFQLVSSPVPSVSETCSISTTQHFLPRNTNARFFARIGPSLGTVNPSAIKKVERYAVQKVAGDGRCMFRALEIMILPVGARTFGEAIQIGSETYHHLKVKGMARNKGIALTPRQERDDADELRTAVKEVICDSDEERLRYQEAVIAITVDEPLKRYCQRIGRSDFWGGESELLVLSELCHQPIVVYIPENEHKNGGGSGFIPIAEYGVEYSKASWKREPRKVVRLLYSGRNHYDLLV